MKTSESHVARGDSHSTISTPSVRPLAETLAAMSAAISSGDAAAAASLIAEAQTNHAGDPSVGPSVVKCGLVIRRSGWLDTALEAMHRDLDEDRFTSALGHFREALGLSRGLPVLKSRVDQMAVRHSKSLLPANWRIAETILQEGSQVEPAFSPPPELLDQLKSARERESIDNAIHQADQLWHEGRESEARQKLAALSALYPEDKRISAKINSLDAPAAPVAIQAHTAAPAAAAELPGIPLPASAANRPTDSELDTEGALTDPMPDFLAPWRARIFISHSAWNVIKNFCALAATAAMLGLSGILVWHHLVGHHFSRPQARPSGVSRMSPPRAQQPPQTLLAQPEPAGAERQVFENIPAPPSEQDSILRSVETYAGQSGTRLAGKIVDEVAMKGNQASVRYRPREKDVGGAITFILVRQAGIWKVRSAQ